jgi:hypothetical protein
MNRRWLSFGVIAGLLVVACTSVAPAPASAAKCRTFPANNYWKADIRSLPVHPLSSAWLGNMGASSSQLHPDFGPSGGTEPAYGIPITYVRTSRHRVPVTFDYADESDQVRYPLSLKTRIEGGWNSDGDRHAIVVDRSRCRLYETWDTHRTAAGQWHAGSGATWSLRKNRLRPDGWTSADAAGLPILPGLLRWKEVRAGSVRHAIRFTTDDTSAHHLWPARHDASDETSWSYPPMGARFRLDSSFSEAGFSPYARAVIAAMKIYGLVLADNGSRWFFQGEQHAGWPPSLIDELKRIPASAFVAVDTSQLPHSPDSAAVG